MTRKGEVFIRKMTGDLFRVRAVGKLVIQLETRDGNEKVLLPRNILEDHFERIDRDEMSGHWVFPVCPDSPPFPNPQF